MAATLCENVNGQLKPVGGQFIEPFSYSYTPIGSIVPILGTTVPDGYLVCDGSSYNIEDYQELAAYFVDQFGSVNYFGGNGLTTFAIPNITGAPSDVLSCIAVKNLYFANTGVTPSDSFVLRSQILTFNNENVAIVNAPNVTSATFFFVFYHDSSRSLAQDADITVRSGSGELIFTAENAPSGSIVCDIMCTNFEHITGGGSGGSSASYSTTEQAVGTWIDGSSVYQKTYAFINISLSSSWTDESLNIDWAHIWIESGHMIVGTDTFPFPYPQEAGSYLTAAFDKSAGTISIKSAKSRTGDLYVTVRYVKTAS